MTDDDGFGAEEALTGLDVSCETVEALELVVEALHEWRLRSNLIGPAEAGRVWRRHVFDSLQLVPHLDLSGRIVDLGSGAGFPGLILSVLAKAQGGYVTMVESVGKKCAFLRHAVEVAGLQARVLNERVEAVRDVPADYVTARAFAPLPKLLDYAAPWLMEGAVGVFPKGRRWKEELTEASDCWTFAHDVIPSQSGDGVILIVREVTRGV